MGGPLADQLINGELQHALRMAKSIPTQLSATPVSRQRVKHATAETKPAVPPNYFS